MLKIYYFLLQVAVQVAKLIAEDQLYVAVQLHAQSMLMLGREGIQVVSIIVLL